MKVNSSIFRSNDIRGIYPQDLNEEVLEYLGRAFIAKRGVKNIVVGRDMRVSSPQLLEALVRGILKQGANVYNIGEVPTECVYFAVGKYGYAGIMITASHNPKEYNGLKVVGKGGDIVRGEDLLRMVQEGNFPSVLLRGKMYEVDIWQDYLDHIFSFVDVKNMKEMKVVVDASNGMAGKVIPQIATRLPIEIIPLNFELDGNFPAHAPNPLVEGATDQLQRKVLEEKADLGVIFDADADRIYFLDEMGDTKSGSETLLILAKYFLEKNPGMGITYNTVCSKAVAEFVAKWGGKPIRVPVGYANTREGLINHNGIMGGEFSGHYAFKDNFYSDSGFISFLVALEIISTSGKKVSELMAELSPYFRSPELNFEIQDKEKVLEQVKSRYTDGKQDFSDGVTVEYQDWWFNVRPSNTEPLLRLMLEADTKKLLEEKQKELVTLIKKEQ